MHGPWDTRKTLGLMHQDITKWVNSRNEALRNENLTHLPPHLQREIENIEKANEDTTEATGKGLAGRSPKGMSESHPQKRFRSDVLYPETIEDATANRGPEPH